MPTELHELIKEFLRDIVPAYLLEADIPFYPLGRTTWKRRILERGLEADGCYYIQHVDQAEQAETIDLERDPPPDLAIEVEVTEPLVNKLDVYAALGIGEVWHVKGDLSVQFLSLDDQHRYCPIVQSRAIPYFTPQIVSHWLERRSRTTHFKAMQQFRDEVLKRG